MPARLFLTTLVAAFAFGAAIAPSALANTAPHCNDSDLTSDGSQVGIGSACSDPDRNAPFTFRIVSQPAHGVAQAYNAPSPAGVGYRPEAGFVGTDSFTYVVSDGEADSNVATVRITVGSPPAPTCSSSGYPTTPPGSSYVVRLTCAPGGDGLPITFVIDTAPAHATYELRPFNDFTTDLVMRTAGDFSGTDAVTWHGVGPRGLASAPVVWSWTLPAATMAPITAVPPDTGTPPAAEPTPPLTRPTIVNDPFATLGAEVTPPKSRSVSLRSGHVSGGLFSVRCTRDCQARLTGSFNAHGHRVAVTTQRVRLRAGASRTLRVRVPSDLRSKLGPRPTLRLRLVVSRGGQSAARDATLLTVLH